MLAHLKTQKRKHKSRARSRVPSPSLTKNLQKLFSEKQEHKVSYRCSLPSPLQKRSKDQKGLHWCQNPAEDLLASTLKITRSSKTMDTCGALNSRSPLLGSGTNAILFDPWIFSAMAMAMSIYRTLCVLVSLHTSLMIFSLQHIFNHSFAIV